VQSIAALLFIYLRHTPAYYEVFAATHGQIVVNMPALSHIDALMSFSLPTLITVRHHHTTTGRKN